MHPWVPRIMRSGLACRLVQVSFGGQVVGCGWGDGGRVGEGEGAVLRVGSPQLGEGGGSVQSWSPTPAAWPGGPRGGGGGGGGQIVGFWGPSQSRFTVHHKLGGKWENGCGNPVPWSTEAGGKKIQVPHCSPSVWGRESRAGAGCAPTRNPPPRRKPGEACTCAPEVISTKCKKTMGSSAAYTTGGTFWKPKTLRQHHPPHTRCHVGLLLTGMVLPMVSIPLGWGRVRWIALNWIEARGRGRPLSVGRHSRPSRSGPKAKGVRSPECKPPPPAADWSG